MKLTFAAVALAIAATGALADPITKHTITGRASAAATAQSAPLDMTPKPAPEPQASVEGDAAPARPKIARYGLLGLSWRSE